MILKNIRLGILDHSGVLSDDRIPVHKAFEIVGRKYGCKVHSLEKLFLSAKPTPGEYFISIGVNEQPEKLNHEYSLAYAEVTAGNKIVPVMYKGIPEVLKKLKSKGLRLAVVSSHPENHVIDELKKYNILHLFDRISGNPKPKTARLHDMCCQFDVLPQEAVFVEDTDYGLDAGIRANVHCFGITTGYHTREMLGAKKVIDVIDSLDELLAYINPNI